MGEGAVIKLFKCAVCEQEFQTEEALANHTWIANMDDIRDGTATSYVIVHDDKNQQNLDAKTGLRRT